MLPTVAPCPNQVTRQLLAAAAVLTALLSSCAPSAGRAPSTAHQASPSSSFPRGIVRFGSSDYATMAAAGFSVTTDGNDNSVLERLGSSGLNGLVWLGGWNNAGCSWEYSDSKVIGIVDAVKGNPRVLAYQVGDEPDAKACPRAPDAYAARTTLVHQRDSVGLTLTILNQLNEISSKPVSTAPTPFKGAVDIPAFDVYPCFEGQRRCDFAMIDRAVSAIKSMKLPRWWAVIQDFQYGQWRWPTRSELDGQFRAWAGSGMSGYLVFAWDYMGSRITSQPGHVAQLRSNNSSFRDH